MNLLLYSCIVSVFIFSFIKEIFGLYNVKNTACSVIEVFVFDRICSKDEFVATKDSSTSKQKDAVYVLFDINPPEGFNLRRDVYIRMAVFMKNLRKSVKFKNAKLVLPPFPRLYHWRSINLQQDKLFWNHFFDLDSLREFTEVLDFWQFFDEVKTIYNAVNLTLDAVYQLQHFEEMFQSGVFTEKFEIAQCAKNVYHPKTFFGYTNITERRFDCLQFHGSAMLLKNVLRHTLSQVKKSEAIVHFVNAEIVLHDMWGNHEFWEARRSMRFNKKLIAIANSFRETIFKSTDKSDLVQRPDKWKMEKPYRGAKGGDYLCAHLRRADFLRGRGSTTPSLHSAAYQIKEKLNEFNLEKVYISSDCNGIEFNNLKTFLGRSKAYRFTPESDVQRQELKDGGMAIIDQIICSHARYFIGTYESTFTYRIYEEREILGFQKDTTFNTFCKNEDGTNCEKNSVWPIVFK